MLQMLEVGKMKWRTGVEKESRNIFISSNMWHI